MPPAPGSTSNIKAAKLENTQVDFSVLSRVEKASNSCVNTSTYPSQPEVPAVSKGFFVLDGQEMCVPSIVIIRKKFIDQQKEVLPRLMPFFESHIKFSGV